MSAVPLFEAITTPPTIALDETQDSQDCQDLLYPTSTESPESSSSSSCPNLWPSIKKFLQPDKLIICDLGFKICTKASPALLFLLLCLSIGNRYVREIVIDCHPITTFYVTIPNDPKHLRPYQNNPNDIIFFKKNDNGIPGGYEDEESDETTTGTTKLRGTMFTSLNVYCWNMNTFLVAKALRPKWSSKISFPGVAAYDRKKDKLIWQSYYKYVWLILGVVGITFYLPYFVWKMIIREPLQQILQASSPEQRVAHFLAKIGRNSTFATWFSLCKLTNIAAPIICWGLITMFIGSGYTSYGTDVVNYIYSAQYYGKIGNGNKTSSRLIWPNPKDVLFPKMTKCEWAKFDYTGALELISAQCGLPMNNINQYIFFYVWWWSALVFCLAMGSFLYYIILAIPSYRAHRYKSIVRISNYNELELIKLSRPGFDTDKSCSSAIHVKMRLGDYILLNLIKTNMNDLEFKQFIGALAITIGGNTILWLDPNPNPKSIEPIIITNKQEQAQDSSSSSNNEKSPDEELPGISFINETSPQQSNGYEQSGPFGLLQPASAPFKLINPKPITRKPKRLSEENKDEEDKEENPEDGNQQSNNNYYVVPQKDSYYNTFDEVWD